MSALLRRVPVIAAATAAMAAIAVTATACSTAKDGTAGAGRALGSRYETVVRDLLPSVVEIRAGGLTGSGVVLNSDGDIVTSAHVVGGARRFEVLTSGVSTPLHGRLVGTFAPDDLAVIKISHPRGELRPARWADSATIQVGDIVLAMGSPFGLADSVTQGIVSATGRTVRGPSDGAGAPATIADAIQTSAPINPGNSGGALVLLSGYVIGIPTLSARDPQLGTPAEGIGFAIPANTVLQIARQLIRQGKVTRPGTASLQFAGRTHVSSSGKSDGVSVDSVRQAGATARAGIRPGDVIVGIGGAATASLNQLDSVLAEYRPGEKVRVEMLRTGAPRQVNVTLGGTRG
jgi:S1-C subfamily serine protease